jgi:TATA-binding protein-associated factor Taf7
MIYYLLLQFTELIASSMTSSSDDGTVGGSTDSEADEAVLVPLMERVEYYAKDQTIAVHRQFGIVFNYKVEPLAGGRMRCLKCGEEQPTVEEAKEHADQHAYLTLEAAEFRARRREGRQARIERHEERRAHAQEDEEDDDDDY